MGGSSIYMPKNSPANRFIRKVPPELLNAPISHLAIEYPHPDQHLLPLRKSFYRIRLFMVIRHVRIFMNERSIKVSKSVFRILPELTMAWSAAFEIGDLQPGNLFDLVVFMNQGYNTSSSEPVVAADRIRVSLSRAGLLYPLKDLVHEKTIITY
jgi:hypothetical protein